MNLRIKYGITDAYAISDDLAENKETRELRLQLRFRF